GQYATTVYISQSTVEVSTHEWDPKTRVLAKLVRIVTRTGDELWPAYYGYDSRGRRTYFHNEDPRNDYTLEYSYSEDGKEVTVWSLPNEPSEGRGRINYIATLDEQGRSVKTRYPTDPMA